ncbi:hypothetical protein CABS01_03237 [Colletotrichum abscissum]|uniref:uncharacterized protein n=1 Tax=Colletotrichum abscissum TaxID=1671311 RepID=UPI0027D51F10|nr:uncharacterized protein CABS01_03237 [Colletotrichum abscissum]KAK1477935.1 hypothetical protein CABS01_03237 [Colletotrichum abscissum]
MNNPAGRIFDSTLRRVRWDRFEVAVCVDFSGAIAAASPLRLETTNAFPAKRLKDLSFSSADTLEMVMVQNWSHLKLNDVEYDSAIGVNIKMHPYFAVPFCQILHKLIPVNPESDTGLDMACIEGKFKIHKAPRGSLGGVGGRIIQGSNQAWLKEVALKILIRTAFERVADVWKEDGAARRGPECSVRGVAVIHDTVTVGICENHRLRLLAMNCSELQRDQDNGHSID